MIGTAINLCELPPLADPTHKIKRATICFVGVVDVVVIAVGIYSIFEILFSDYDLSDAPPGTQAPWEGLQSLAFELILALL